MDSTDAREERVARAICQAMGIDPDRRCFTDLFASAASWNGRDCPMPNWRWALRVARAAIKAADHGGGL